MKQYKQYDLFGTIGCLFAPIVLAMYAIGLKQLGELAGRYIFNDTCIVNGDSIGSLSTYFYSSCSPDFRWFMTLGLGGFVSLFFILIGFLTYKIIKYFNNSHKVSK